MKETDITVQEFSEALTRKMTSLPLITIYHGPDDYPDNMWRGSGTWTGPRDISPWRNRSKRYGRQSRKICSLRRSH